MRIFLQWIAAIALVAAALLAAQSSRTVAGEVYNEPLMITAGSNSVLLMQAPVAGTVCLYRNGFRMKPYSDYALAGRAATFAVALSSDDTLLADYRF